jgi:hypothetical protein
VDALHPEGVVSVPGVQSYFGEVRGPAPSAKRAAAVYAGRIAAVALGKFGLKI